ncbi:NAD(P)-dependent oxidoreductase [Photobacterium sp. MCCC 1A19761]|uniref:NAD-dependent epimerase/dehydratase family protein n=1 Tax=Photobacterium sp. MCCC 1A19761 TaxID=3115000 RepID=UPI00307EF8DA
MNKKVLVTGSSGHLGSALVKVLKRRGFNVLSIDIKPSETTDIVASISDKDVVHRAMKDVDAVLHAATLHKPHVVTHTHQEFLDSNISGTLNLLEAAKKNQVRSFVYVSTTSTFGDSLIPPKGYPAAWITESTKPVPKNIYGVTKNAAEDICQLFYRNHKLPCLVLKLSRFFQEEDDCKIARANFSPDNLKVNEYLYRRVDIQDAVDVILLAMEKAPTIGFDRFIVSATTPFSFDDMAKLRVDVQEVIKNIYPEYHDIYQSLGWKMNSTIDRVYVNTHARNRLEWNPVYNFKDALNNLVNGNDFRSELALEIGIKGYHDESFENGPYPVFEDAI